MRRKFILKKKFLKKGVQLLCPLLAFAPLQMVSAASLSSVEIHARILVNVTGKVVNVQGEPIIGATVALKGTTTGTKTDLDGVFRMNLPKGDEVLVVSYVGYKTQEFPVNNLTDFEITLEAADVLDEVVVVGYGTQKRAHLTGAIQTIDAAEIEDLPSTNIAASLSGRLLGVDVSEGTGRPGTSANINVRKAYTVSKDGGTYQPLYVIDGVIQTDAQGSPDNTAFNALVPSEIESLTVVKDAAAAVYGSRGANGVIIITTKRGKVGAPRISYSGSIAFNDEAYRPKMMNAYEFAQYMNIMNGPYGASAKQDKNSFFSEDELEHFKTINHDWLDAAWKSAHLTQHSLNASGGTERATYFANVSYQSQNGNLSTVDYSRWNFRAGSDVQVSQNFKAGIQVSGNYSDRIKTFNKISGENDDNDYRTLITKPRYIPMYVNGYPVRGPGANDLSQYHFFELEKYNNLSDAKEQAMAVNIFAEYEVPYVEGLKARVSYARNFSSGNTQRVGVRYNLYNFNMLGQNEHIYDGAEVSGSVSVKNDDRISYINQNGRSQQYNFSLSYNRKFGLHEVSGLFNIERAEARSGQQNVMKDGPLLTNNGQFNTAFGAIDGATFAYESGSLGYIGRVNYVYDDRYLAELLYRSDASTRFAPENYWGNFLATSFGWVLSEENFFDVSWIDFLKVRYSFGKLGKDDTRAWNWRQRYTFQQGKGTVFGGNGNATMGMRMEASPNRDAKWSDSYQQNFGVDARFMRSRLSVGIDGYLYQGRNELMEMTANLPVTVGGTVASVNMGSIDRFGVDLSVGWNDKVGGDFRYGAEVRFSWSDDKVRRGNFNPQDMLLPWRPQQGRSSDNGVWGMDYLGMFRNQADIDAYVSEYGIKEVFGVQANNLMPGMLYYRDVRGALQPDGTFAGPDGIVDENDQIQLARKQNNHYQLATTINLGYKNFSFSMVVAGSFGGFSEFDSNSRKKLHNSINRVYENKPVFWNDIFDPELNPNGRYPNPHWEEISLRQTSTFWQVPAFRMSVRSANLGYTLPKHIAEYAKISNARLFVSAMNPLTLYNPFTYRDATAAYDVYPNLRTYSLGVNVTF